MVKQAQNCHDKELRNAKSRIDNKPPSDYSNLFKSSGKKKVLKLMRNREIELENNILLGKLFGIIKSQKEITQQPGPRSMNLVMRKNEIRRINQQNKVILTGLKTVKPI